MHNNHMLNLGSGCVFPIDPSTQTDFAQSVVLSVVEKSGLVRNGRPKEE